MGVMRSGVTGGEGGVGVTGEGGVGVTGVMAALATGVKEERG